MPDAFARPDVATTLAPRPMFLDRKLCRDQDYLDAIIAWLKGAKPTVVAEILNVPRATALLVIASPEWHVTARTYQDAILTGESTRMSRVISTALDACMLRLEEGDPVVDTKTGAVRYVPVKARDAAAIAAVLMERRERIERKLGGGDERDPLEDLVRLADVAGKLRELGIRPTVTQPATIEHDITPLRGTTAALILTDGVDA